MRSLVAVMAIASVVNTARAQAPTPRELSGVPDCASCRLDVRKVLTLGSPNDPELFWQLYPTIAVDASGNFLVASAEHVFIMFDSTGTFKGTRGRLGESPGAFGRGGNAVFPMSRDTLVVLTDQTMLFLDGSWNERYRMQLPSRNMRGRATVVLHDGSLVDAGNEWGINRAKAGPDTNDMQMRVLSLNAPPATWSFGRFTTYDFCLSCEVVSLSVAAAPDEFWSLKHKDYSLQRWLKDGNLLETIRVRGSPWFDQWTQLMRNPTPPATPHAPIMSAHLRPDGLMLISAVGPANDSKSLGNPPQLTGPTSFIDRNMPLADRAASTFDILDLRNGVLASTRIEHVDLRPISPDFAMRYVRHDSGLLLVEIWKIEFRRY